MIGGNLQDLTGCLRWTHSEEYYESKVSVPCLNHTLVFNEFCSFIVLFRNLDPADFVEGFFVLAKDELDICLCLRLTEYVSLGSFLVLRYDV